MAKHRLKPAWVEDWIKNPEALQPGTMMPGFFPEGQSPSPNVLGGDADKQIEAIRDYLYRYETSPKAAETPQPEPKKEIEKKAAAG
jgi:hypothetical protein